MKYFIKTYEKAEELPNSPLFGYIWLSDREEPIVISNKEALILKGKNPFIVEGFLLNQDKTRSYTLSNQNGRLIIYEYDLTAIESIDKDSLTYQTFLTHRIQGENHSRIKFITVWLPVKDSVCEGMEVLKPMMRVFNGFE